MPTGKARTRVAFIDRPDFSRLDVQLQFLTEHRRAGYSLPTDEPSEITVAAIRNALEMYVGCHRKTPPITLTVRRKTLNALWEAVQAALSDPRDGATVREAAKWIAKLDINARNDLYHFLTAAARDGKIGKSDPIAFLQWPRGGWNCLPLVLDYCAAPGEALWPDPYLVHLVFDLADPWRALTGRRLRAEDANKDSLLGQWIALLVRTAAPAMQLARPPSAVEDILRAHKAEK